MLRFPNEGKLQCLSSYNYVTWLRMTLSSSIHLCTDFIYANNRLIFYCAIYHILLPIHSLMDIRLFPFLGCCEWSSKEQDEQVSLWLSIGVIGISPRVVQLDHFESLSSFLKELHTDFHSGFSTLHSHQQWISASLLNFGSLTLWQNDKGKMKSQRRGSWLPKIYYSF